MSLRQAAQVVDDALSRAGGDDCIVIVEDSDEAEVRFANNTTTTNGRRRDRRVVVIRFAQVQGGISAGVASSSGDVDLGSLLDAAAADAAGSPPSWDVADLLGGEADNDFEADVPEAELQGLTGVIDGLRGAFDAAEAVGHVLAGIVEHRMDTVHLGSSTGLRRRHSQPSEAMQMIARARDGRQSAWAGRAGDLSSVEGTELEAHLAKRLGWARRTESLPPGRYEVVLPPEAVADLMVDLTNYASGQDALDGRTVFSAQGGGTRIGERLSRLPFDLYGDPAEPGLECIDFAVAGASSSDASVFDNGAPIGRTAWLDKGTLANLRFHRAGARRADVSFCPYVDNLVLDLDGSRGTVEDLVAHTSRGLLLTALWYIREVDPSTLLLTGLTRDGVYLIEGGEVVGAVNNFRFNESPVDLLARTIEAGTPARALGREFGEWANRAKMPPLRVADFNMSTTSEAS
ncbi:MAG: metallopeptidase TldD-related protein [Acidimicrobiales bacterium]